VFDVNFEEGSEWNVKPGTASASEEAHEMKVSPMPESASEDNSNPLETRV